MRLVLLALVACGPTYWRGPVERLDGPIVDERLGDAARIRVTIAWGAQLEDRARPAWLGPAGEPWSEELATRYGSGMFHNGRMRSLVTLDFAIGARGDVELAGCEPIRAVKRTHAELATEIQRCAARFVDEAGVTVQIDDNPTWSVAVIQGNQTQRVRLFGTMTLIHAIAMVVPPGSVLERRVWLQLPGSPPRRIDIKAIAEGRSPDLPLAVGDVIRID